jgi:hypothetical protein
VAEDAPQVCYSKSEQQFLARRKAAAAVRQEFRAIMAVGKKGRRESVSVDSYGNSQRIESSSPGSPLALTGEGSSPMSRDVSLNPNPNLNLNPSLRGSDDDARSHAGTNRSTELVRETRHGARPAAKEFSDDHQEAELLRRIAEGEAALRARGQYIPAFAEPLNTKH